MYRVIRKQYIDPFEVPKTINVEVVLLDRIYFYSKRTSSPPYEPQFYVYKFSIIGENVLEDSGLTIWEYFDLLKSKPEEIQEKYNFDILDYTGIYRCYTFEEIAQYLGIEELYSANKESYDAMFRRNIFSPY